MRTIRIMMMDPSMEPSSDYIPASSSTSPSSSSTSFAAPVSTETHINSFSFSIIIHCIGINMIIFLVSSSPFPLQAASWLPVSSAFFDLHTFRFLLAFSPSLIRHAFVVVDSHSAIASAPTWTNDSWNSDGLWKLLLYSPAEDLHVFLVLSGAAFCRVPLFISLPLSSFFSRLSRVPCFLVCLLCFLDFKQITSSVLLIFPHGFPFLRSLSFKT